ncbi:MAG: hypothetical protein R3Y63_08555 [Eubacteriales bacterium]
MTTQGINGISPNYAPNTAGVQKSQREDEEKVEGRTPPPPPSQKNFDTYTPSAEATAALAALSEELSEEVDDTTEADVDADILAELAKQDEEEVTTETESETETSKGIDLATATRLKAEQQEQAAAFLQKLAGMIKGQMSASYTKISDIIGEIAEGISETDRAEAEEAVSEDGYWGVEQTANRIFDMAYALAGGDADKADEMMSYIEKGFEEAEAAWGDELPSITGDTKARIDELFAEWTSTSGVEVATGA